ncbi:nickel ABC transporter permease subunit NikB [Enterococcus plantarum]|uniref:Nickel ABC transporter permease subunit NikB n=1 Tax=Enterococcus plantarum TaxID=1077675 RepID=A0A2W3Z264_9ENTE|nr:ABC transporter permease subunit [Enterococcus plantarum]PZL71420.1 nickel ABC transporter permease subunit NikB [Enterococcus plantarum]
MIKSIIKNCGKILLLLFLITFIPFFLLTYLSNDPAEVALRVQAITPTEQNVRQMRSELGLDQPFFSRYIDWVQQALKGDLGKSYATGKSIAGMISEAFPYTVFLTLVTLIIIIVTCLVLGILAANYQNHWTEKVLRLITFVLNAIPSFWLGLLLIFLFSVKLNWLPTGGAEGLLSVFLPALTLSLAYSSSYIRLIRNDLLQNKQLPYVDYYFTRGFSKKTITKHLLKNSLRSSVVSIGVSIPKLIAGSIIIESVFAWPGMGLLCINAIRNRDLPVLQAYIVIMSLFFISSSLLIDSLNKRIDPRLRERGS